MRESWSTRWYTPLLVLAGALLVLLVLALAAVEVLTAAAPNAGSPPHWTRSLDRAAAALGEGDTAAALASWREAHAAALRSGQWEGMIEVGDASRQLDEAGGADGVARARHAYLTALFRARRQRSLDGVLRAAAAFGELGDRDVLAHALRVAEREAGRDSRAQERVRTVADRWMSPPLETERHDRTTSGGRQP